MPNLKDLKNRIDSVTSTRKITKAMQMVAASKLRRAQLAAEAARPYSERMATVLENLAETVSDGDDAPRLLAGTGSDQTHLLVVCTAERGLCGGFNTSIAKLARLHAEKLLADGKTVKMLFVGKKGYDVLKRQFAPNFLDLVDLRAVKRVAFTDADGIGQRILSLFDENGFDVCTLFYSEFKTVMTQVPTARQLIPARIAGSDDTTAAANSDAIYEYEPDEEAILNELLPRNLSVQVFRALLENAASEMGAKMTAMDSATRNAGDMIEALTLTYNRTRQAKITTELIEIISGAEAL